VLHIALTLANNHLALYKSGAFKTRMSMLKGKNEPNCLEVKLVIGFQST